MFHRLHKVYVSLFTYAIYAKCLSRLKSGTAYVHIYY